MVRDGGTNFAVASSVADNVVLCLFDGGVETRLPLPGNDGDVWHGFVPGVGAGQEYGYRVSGPWDPGRGLLCNQAKLLLDPYARAITGSVTLGPAVLGYSVDNPDQPSLLDSADHVARGLVAADTFAWGDDARPRYHYADTIIYETHVKGFTMRHPGVPAELRGTYAGLAHEAAIAHLLDLGVTTVELLPVQEWVPDESLLRRDLTNYWGYNTIGYFAPHQGYSADVRAGLQGGQVAEFKRMVSALHAAGLEVLIDIAFTHTAEGDHRGPTLCFRGLDNPAYYHLDAVYPAFYAYYSQATGNTLNAGDPVTMRLIMDAMRYWLKEMHVDGFHFGLAGTLGRQENGYYLLSMFLDMISQDPDLSSAKIVADPWDIGQMDSYDVGRFPPRWREWNGKYRDTVRDFWRGRPVGLGEFASRFCGSSDLYSRSGRHDTSSVNLITGHDGFTLRDLVSYDQPHNEANGEPDDGNPDNRSWNCGAEGPTSDPEVLALRARQSRAMLATLLLSFGVPMLLGGDEIGRTQNGNNYAYCQDNEISWFDWSTADSELLRFARKLVAFRMAHPVLRRRRFLGGAEASELGWFTAFGEPMTGADWADPAGQTLALYLNGSDDPDLADDGTPMVDDDLLVLVNGWDSAIEFVIPVTAVGQKWKTEIDSYEPAAAAQAPVLEAGERHSVGARSIVVLRGYDSAV